MSNWKPFDPNRFVPQPKVYSPKKEKKPLKAKKKPTGEKQLFDALAAIRKHISHFSGVPIKSPQPINWMHILSKKLYPHFRLYPKNIVLGTEDEHYKHHNIARSDWDEPFRKEIERMESELKNEYKQRYGK